jgi:uncharacterized protein (DUF1697 family)
VFFAEPPEVPDLGDIGAERAAARGREIYCWHPDGVRNSPLIRALGRLGGVSTARNWNTVRKLEALL